MYAKVGRRTTYTNSHKVVTKLG